MRVRSASTPASGVCEHILAEPTSPRRVFDLSAWVQGWNVKTMLLAAAAGWATADVPDAPPEARLREWLHRHPATFCGSEAGKRHFGHGPRLQRVAVVKHMLGDLGR